VSGAIISGLVAGSVVLIAVLMGPFGMVAATAYRDLAPAQPRRLRAWL